MTDLFIALAGNPIFAGVAGGAAVSALLYSLRSAPKVIWAWLEKRLTVTLVIDNSEELFSRLAIYLSSSPYVRRARWLRMVELYDYAEQRWHWTASFGLGWHLFRDEGRWFLLHRAIDQEGKSLIPQRRETITLRTLGPAQEPIRGLMDRAEHVYRDTATTRVHIWHKGDWLLADQKPPRGLDTVFIPAAQKERLASDLARFLSSQQLYRRRGTPWRRGYLLEGPPGTGKTTLAFVLACMAKRPVYMINLNTCGGDTGLISAFNSTEPGGVVVIEDIDTAKVSHDRSVAAAMPGLDVKPEESVTLGGLLNAVDGLASRENRILIVTSNHADRLDPALIRPGRIDHRETIGLMRLPEAQAMATAFLGDDGPAWVVQVAGRLPIAPAELQGMLLAAADQAPFHQVFDPEEAA